VWHLAAHMGCQSSASKARLPVSVMWAEQMLLLLLLQVLFIPEGLTLVGIAGRAGDSWDQVRGRCRTGMCSRLCGGVLEVPVACAPCTVTSSMHTHAQPRITM
jgi:hypothetical protein